MQAIFLLRICGLCLFNSKTSLNETNMYKDGLFLENMKCLNTSFVVFVDKELIPRELSDLCKDKVIINEYIGDIELLFKDFDHRNVDTCTKTHAFGIWLCGQLLLTLVTISSNLNDNIVAYIHELVFYDACRRRPLSIIISMAQIYDSFPSNVTISSSLKSKMEECNFICSSNNVISNASLLYNCLICLDKFIIHNSISLVDINSSVFSSQEYLLGENFDLLLSLILSSSLLGEYNKRNSFGRDLIIFITMKFRISSIYLLTELSLPSISLVWRIIIENWTSNTPINNNNMNITSSAPVEDTYLSSNEEKLNNNHWIFLILDILFSSLSAGSFGSPSVSNSKQLELKKSCSSVFSRIFSLVISASNKLTYEIFLSCILEYLKARLVFMTYTSNDLQSVLVNKKAFLPTLSMNTPSNLKLFAARVVRRNLSLGPNQSIVSNIWKVDSNSSFVHSSWCLSSFSITFVKVQIESFGKYFQTALNGSFDDLISALLEFEQVTNTLCEIDSQLSFVLSHQSDYNTNISNDIELDNVKSNAITNTNIENMSYDDDITAQVNTYFKKLYSQEFSVDQYINIIKALQVNQIHSTGNDATRENKVFNTILHTLFEECRSFTKYPIVELSIAAELIGKLINNDIFNQYGNALVFMLRCIIEALKKNPENKIFIFGLIAIKQFLDRFICFPQFLSVLIKIPSLNNHIPEHIKYCNECLILLPENLHNSLYISSETLKSLNINIPKPSKELYSVLSVDFHTKSHYVGDISTYKRKIKKLGSIITLDLNGKSELPAGVNISQLQGFGLGTIERLINDPEIFDQILTPDDKIVEQVFTLCNTLANTNLEAKINEMAVIINNNPNICEWFALYLVKARASKERNNHSTYISFLFGLDALIKSQFDKFDQNRLSDKKDTKQFEDGVRTVEHINTVKVYPLEILNTVTLATYECIKVLLCYSSLLNEVSSYVNVLRNLGHWIGQLTLAINKPINHKYINPKKLIINAHKMGCLSTILSFICKILENIKGTVFEPPNPWTSTILSLLTEIHSVSILSSLLFEVELLFKLLEIQMEDFPSNNILSDNLNSVPRKLEANTTISSNNVLDSNLSNNEPNDVASVSFISKDAQLITTFSPASNIQNLVPTQSSQYNIGSSMQCWANQVLISPSIALFQIQPSLRPLVPLALDRATREILQVVILRSLKIAAITTKEIVSKDFAFEPDENIFKRAAKLMVATLAGSLAVAVCKEPLRVAFTGQMRQLLSPNPPREGDDQILIEQVVQVLYSDNIDLGIQIVEQAVIEKAIEEVNEVITPCILARQKARESGHNFVDLNYYGSQQCQVSTNYWTSLPDSLKYKSGSLNHLQLYKDFLQLTHTRALEKRGDIYLSNQETHNTSHQLPVQGVNLQNTLSSTYRSDTNFSTEANIQVPQSNQYFHESSNINVQQGNQNHSIPLNSSINSSQANHSTNAQRNISLSAPIEPVKPPLITECRYQPLMMRLEDCLSQLKDTVREIALYPPILIKPPSKINSSSSSNLFSKCFCQNNECEIPPSTANNVLNLLSYLSLDHNLFYLFRVISSIIYSASNSDEILIGITQKLFKTLFDSAIAFQQVTIGASNPTSFIISSIGCDLSLLYMEIFLSFLYEIYVHNSTFWHKIKKESANWFLSVVEDPKYAVDIIIGAIRYDMLILDDFDMALFSLLENATNNLANNINISDSQQHNINIVEFVFKLYYRSFEEWHVPINKKLPLTTQIFTNVLIMNTSTFQHIYSLPVIVSGPSSKPFPLTTVIGELKLKIEPYLSSIQNNQGIDQDININWVGENPPMIMNLKDIINYNRNKSERSSYVAIPYPISVSVDIVKGVSTIFDEWILLLRITVFDGIGTSDKGYLYRSLFLQRLSRQGLLKLDETTEKFFTICTERAIYLSLPNNTRNNEHNKGKINTNPLNNKEQIHVKLYNEPTNDTFTLDALVRLITIMTRYVDPQQMAAVVIIHKFLMILVRIIYRQAEKNGLHFNQHPFFRIIYSLLKDFSSINFNNESTHFTCLISVVYCLNYLNPNRLPVFTYSWIQLISSNHLFPHLLKHYKGWQPYQSLLLQLFKFISPFLKSVQLTPNIKSIYGALLRLLLVLLHDFPEFLCDYNLSFCDVLPTNCVQIRNLILSAFPRNLKLPDPFLPSLKIEILPDIKIPPRVLTNYSIHLLSNDLKNNIDRYWITRDRSIIDVMISKVMISKKSSFLHGTKYSLKTFTAMLLYIGVDLNQNSDKRFNPNYSDLYKTNIDAFQIKTRDNHVSEDSNIFDPSLDIYLYFFEKLDMEGRFVLVSCITNLLGYPNSYTYYFSNLILWLFSNSNDPILQEQITRVLLERLIVHRPHPWGLLITFIELIRNPKYSFWNCSFVHLAPEVEKLFHSVALTCLGQSPIKLDQKSNELK